jgi:O-antigen ligase
MVWGNLGIVVLLMLACASWFWSVSPDSTINGVYLVVKITLIGIYISQIYSPEEILEMLVWVIALGSMLSILVIWKMPEQGILNTYWQGIYSFKNYLGRLMAFGNAILIIYWLKNSGIFNRILALGLFVLSGVLLFYTNSATSLLALAGMYGALVLYFVWIKWVARWDIRAQLFLVALGIASLVLTALNFEIILALLNRPSTSLSYRALLWEILWGWFQRRPAFGFGYAAFWQQLPDGIYIDVEWEFIARHAHNGYIEIALGLGLAGLIVLISALVVLWKRMLILLRKNDQVVLLLPLLALIYLTLANMTYSVAFENPDFHWALFVIAAGMVTPLQIKSQEQPISPQKQISDG